MHPQGPRPLHVKILKNQGLVNAEGFSQIVELKIEVVLPEKERGKEELSASGKGSPRAYQGNGTARHFHSEERLPAPHPYPGAQDCVEAAVCHVKDLENGQWVLGLVQGSEGPRWEGKYKP
ncbi:Apoptosis-inducing factor 3 [Myotis brandtii]|uniref:Apoptosis-inducing factor 3 n=1 Tax=Myotis brandtii TaxID=109478 RepID=S7PRI5_MYOBR|nr:Apoptosis-inducing factor 3 [Myotis brandtii]